MVDRGTRAVAAMKGGSKSFSGKGRRMQKGGRGQRRLVDIRRYIRLAARDQGIVLSGRAALALQDVAHCVAGNIAGKVASISASKKPTRRKWGRLSMNVLKPRTVGAAILLALGAGDFAADASMYGRDAVARYETHRAPPKPKTDAIVI